MPAYGFVPKRVLQFCLHVCHEQVGTNECVCVIVSVVDGLFGLMLTESTTGGAFDMVIDASPARPVPRPSLGVALAVQTCPFSVSDELSTAPVDMDAPFRSHSYS